MHPLFAARAIELLEGLQWAPALRVFILYVAQTLASVFRTLYPQTARRSGSIAASYTLIFTV